MPLMHLSVFSLDWDTMILSSIVLDLFRVGVHILFTLVAYLYVVCEAF